MGIKNTRNNLVESFFIQHSLPRFPLSQNNLFDPNISKRAQHFVCVSMRDEFTGQGGINPKHIQIDSVKECNFFKLLWHYARNVNVNFLKNGSDLKNLTQIKTFKEILLGLPNYPIDRSTMNDNGVPSSLDLTSFTIESTGTKDNRLTFQIFAKAPYYNIDIYDDVSALFSIHHDDYDTDKPVEALKTGHLDGKTAMIMIAQSHSDPATLGINQKILVDRDNYFATVHILNSARIMLPTEDGTPEISESIYRDHSKWSVNVVYGHEGYFPPLLCFYDLNRSTKQAQRGGGAFCLNSSLTGSSPASLALWEFFMHLKPDPNSMARLNNADVNEILGKVLPKTVSESESPFPIGSAPESSRFTRVSSSKNRRYSISEEITAIKSDSVDFSRAEYSNQNDQIEIYHPNSLIPSIVPCPYKFSTAALNVKRNGSIPTKMILNIDKAVKNYGLTKLNAALTNYKLEIFSTDDSLQSPSQEDLHKTPISKRQRSFNPEFTHNTVFVTRKKQKTELESQALQNDLQSSAPGSNFKSKSSNIPRSNVKHIKSNWLRPNTNPRTIKPLRSMSKKNMHQGSTTDRESELNEGNFLRLVFSGTPKKTESDAEPYENMFNISYNPNLISKPETSDSEEKLDISFEN